MQKEKEKILYQLFFWKKKSWSKENIRISGLTAWDAFNWTQALRPESSIKKRVYYKHLNRRLRCRRPHSLGCKAQTMLVGLRPKTNELNLTLWTGFNAATKRLRVPKPFGVKVKTFHWKFAVSLEPSGSPMLHHITSAQHNIIISSPMHPQVHKNAASETSGRTILDSLVV